MTHKAQGWTRTTSKSLSQVLSKSTGLHHHGKLLGAGQIHLRHLELPGSYKLKRDGRRQLQSNKMVIKLEDVCYPTVDQPNLKGTGCV
jgi:hypothetical protein